MNRLLRRTFRLQYASNLFAYREAVATHEEMLKPGIAPYLALLGNSVSTRTQPARSKSKEFLSFCATNWKRTLLVPATTEMAVGGNHPWTDAIHEVRALTDEVNAEGFPGDIVLADQASIGFAEGVRVLGFTGWSAWSRQGPSPNSLGFPPLHCYDPKGARSLQPSDGHDLSREDMEWLNRELLDDNQTPTVLLSHGLPSASLVLKGLDDAAYKQSDLMTFYPFGFLFARERCIKACLGGAIGGTVSGVFNGRFLAVNARRSYPAQAAASPDYRPDAFFEYSWMDDAHGEMRGLLEAYARTLPLPTVWPQPLASATPAPKFEAMMA